MEVAFDAAHATDEPSVKRLSNRNGNATIDVRNEEVPLLFLLPNKRSNLSVHWFD